MTIRSVSRREFLLAASATAIWPRQSRAIGWLLPIILPSAFAALAGIAIAAKQTRISERQHAEQMRLSDANLRLAIHQVAVNDRQASRNEMIAILTALIGRDEKFAQTFLANSPVLESVVFDRTGRATSTELSSNFDRFGTRLGVREGEFFVQRAGSGGPVTNQEGADFGLMFSSGDPVPVPVRPRTELSGRESLQIKEVIAEKNKWASVDAFDRYWSLHSIHPFSRARSAQSIDLISAAVVPKTPNADGKLPITFHYFEPRG